MTNKFKDMYKELQQTFKRYLMHQSGCKDSEDLDKLYDEFSKAIFAYLRWRDSCSQELTFDLTHLQPPSGNPFLMHEIRQWEQSLRHWLFEVKNFLLQEKDENGKLPEETGAEYNGKLFVAMNDLIKKITDYFSGENIAFMKSETNMIPVGLYHRDLNFDDFYKFHQLVQFYSINQENQSLSEFLQKLQKIVYATLGLQVPTIATWLGIANTLAHNYRTNQQLFSNMPISRYGFYSDVEFDFPQPTRRNANPFDEYYYSSYANMREQRGKLLPAINDTQRAKQVWHQKKEWQNFCLNNLLFSLFIEEELSLIAIKDRCGLVNGELDHRLRSIIWRNGGFDVLV